MSRAYHMEIRVSDVHSQAEAVKVGGVISKEWGNDAPFYDADDNSFTMGATNNLCGGESPDEFTVRVGHAVWKALGRYVPVEVNATYLEDLPYNTFDMDEDDYEKWKANENPVDVGTGM